jgi:CBS domain containing-hemolysin-like protein
MVCGPPSPPRHSILELLAAHDKHQQALWHRSSAGGGSGDAPASQPPPAAADGINGSRLSILARISSKLTAAAAAAADGSGSEADGSCIDIGGKVEVAPVVVPPGMPLSFVLHLMQEQGLNYVPVIRHHGPLEGLIAR